MDGLFEEIAGGCDNKKVKSLCNKLGKKLSFKKMGDVESLCHLAYWLYILERKEMAKRCVALTHSLQFDGNYNVWSFVHSMWGLEIRMLREEGKNAEADAICVAIDGHTLTPIAKASETPKNASEGKRCGAPTLCWAPTRTKRWKYPTRATWKRLWQRGI